MLHVEALRELRWKGSLIIPGLFAGVHKFEVQHVDSNRARLIQSETFSGLLEPVILVLILGLMRRGFDAMNAALKNVAEIN